VPVVETAVRWNSPFYGLPDQGWFVSFHCFTKYVKATFFQGASLEPVPPEASKDANVRYFHVHEHDDLEASPLASWVAQASRLPGWSP
jgi:hypothetical protein